MRALAFLVAALTVVTIVPVTASAWPVLQATGTEPAGTPQFPLVRTNFTLDFVGSGPISDRFVAGRLDGHQILGCEAPPGWDCFAFPKGPSTVSYRWVGGALPPPALPFALDSITGEPCLRIQFFSGSSDVPDYEVVGCLTVDGPVPAMVSSWGRMKSIYR